MISGVIASHDNDMVMTLQPRAVAQCAFRGNRHHCAQHIDSNGPCPLEVDMCRTLALILAVSFLAAGCGDDDSSSGDTMAMGDAIASTSGGDVTTSTSSGADVGCVAHQDCDPGLTCVLQECVAGCTPEDCAPTNRLCNPDTRACEGALMPGACAEAWQCVHPQTCDTAAGQCLAPASPCNADEGCGIDQYCGSMDECVAGCREDTCDGGEVCNLGTRVCE